MVLHESITIHRLESLLAENMFGMGSYGVCNSCGEEQDGIEFDTVEAECATCGENQVYGLEEILLRMKV
jgi:predicted RNA-binding Zn-ribbon protein involved in translation (DUF1610 family)